MLFVFLCARLQDRLDAGAIVGELVADLVLMQQDLGLSDAAFASELDRASDLALGETRGENRKRECSLITFTILIR